MPRPLSTKKFVKLLDRYGLAMRDLQSIRMSHCEIEKPLLRYKERKVEKLRLQLIGWAVEAITVEE